MLCIYCARRERNLDFLQMQRDVDEFVRLIEREWNHPLEDGYNPDVTFMAHLWEPLRCDVAPGQEDQVCWKSMTFPDEQCEPGLWW